MNMPTKVVVLDESPKNAFITPLNRISVIETIEVTNNYTSDIVITVQDVFTPAPTESNSSPEEVVENRKIIKVAAGDDISINNLNIEILGECLISSSATSTDINVTLTWKYTY